ncbi:MAG TPA: transposase family protein [Chloroflexia bacterium]|jgi:transposase InsO family protein
MLIDLVSSNQGITFDELRKRVEAMRLSRGSVKVGTVANTLNILIVQQELYVDLLNERLSPQYQYRAHVFLNQQMAQAYDYIPVKSPYHDVTYTLGVNIANGVPVNWDGRAWRIANVGETKVSLADSEGYLAHFATDTFKEMITKGEVETVVHGISDTRRAEGELVLLRADVKALNKANELFQQIAPDLNGETPSSRTPSEDRQANRVMKRFREAEAYYGVGYIGLIPKWYLCGAQLSTLPPRVLELMGVYAEKYESPKGQTMSAVHAMLDDACTAEGLDVPRYETFREFLRRRPIHAQQVGRKGPKGAYEFEPFYYELTETTPRHGSRPFDIGHLDHTQGDIELVAFINGVRIELGRPWITLLTDAYSRRILAFYITFDEPSYRSCMMVFRECVRRHGRLPQTLVMDRGAEFRSVYWESLLAHFEIVKKERPGKPRIGTVIERTFGTTNTLFFHNLRGNTQLMRDPRELSESVNPKNLAIWTLPELYVEFSNFCYGVYDERVHGTLGQSPKNASIDGMARAGNRDHMVIPYDEGFLRDTMPSTETGMAKVTLSGVKINYVYYTDVDKIMREPGVLNEMVLVRYDPYDLGTAYAYLKGKWTKLRSEHYLEFQGLTEKVRRIACIALAARNRGLRKHVAITAKSIGAFLNSLEGKEASMLQKIKDREVQPEYLYIVGGASSDPDSAPYAPPTLIAKDGVTVGATGGVGAHMAPGASGQVPLSFPGGTTSDYSEHAKKKPPRIIKARS